MVCKSAFTQQLGTNFNETFPEERPTMTFKADDQVVFFRAREGRWSAEKDHRIYTLLTGPDISGYALATWVDTDHNTRHAKLNVRDVKGYQHYREPTLHTHLMAHPTHTVSVMNTGMPAEVLIASCDECPWEIQW